MGNNVFALFARRHRKVEPGTRLAVNSPKPRESASRGLTGGLRPLVQQRRLISVVELPRAGRGGDTDPGPFTHANVPYGLAVAASLAVKVCGARAGHGIHQRTAPPSCSSSFSGCWAGFPPACATERWTNIVPSGLTSTPPAPAWIAARLVRAA